jgi:ribonucleoside-diphosphate reductase alpha chain
LSGNKGISLTDNALRVLERRYLRKNRTGRVIETPEGLFRRVAKTIAAADERYSPGTKTTRGEIYYRMMSELRFLPNSPTLMNAGTSIKQYSACFVIPVGDSVKKIFGALSAMARIHQSGGGTGFSFSRLRPKDDIVKSTGQAASGPISFMRVFDQATEVIKQGGRRRGANMGILRIDHPDIAAFARAKEDGAFRNFNLSVSIPDTFMRALDEDGEYALINPRDGGVTKKIRAREIWDLIASMAWKTGDPGVIFIDRMNALNPTPAAGVIEATNPCGEQPLLPYESCNLGSVNLSRFAAGGRIDWDSLRHTVRDGVQFLDNVIDASIYPLPEITRITRANRKIGLGVMGFADMLVMLDIPYDSDDAVKLGGEVMKFISGEAVKKSSELGRERGSFPNFPGSVWEKRGLKHMRNATVTTVAPTGTISIIAGTSSGIEPLFALSFVRRVLDGSELREVNSAFFDRAKSEAFYSEALLKELDVKGGVSGLPGVPQKVKEVFKTALEIPPERHVMMQAKFQKYTDNAVSKTINLPESATPSDVEKIYSLAYRLGCKGITVYRYGSKDEQVLSRTGQPSACRVCLT